MQTVIIKSFHVPMSEYFFYFCLSFPIEDFETSFSSSFFNCFSSYFLFLERKKSYFKFLASIFQNNSIGNF